MEAILTVQTDFKASIARAYSNFKKSPLERITREYIETRLENLESDWLMFRKNHVKLLETCAAEKLTKSPYVTNEVYDKAEESYFDYKAALKSKLNKLFSENLSNVSQHKQKNDNEFSPSVKLPKISIPIFSGKYSEWPTFRDLFVSLIHNNVNLDRVQKLHYLKGHLTGEAEQLIRYVPITDSNYVQCWSQLEERYDNKKYLCNCILKRFFGQRRLHIESASGLKELLDTTSDCVSALQNLDINVSSWDVIIIHIITNKLDIETRRQWELYSAGNQSTELPTFQQFKEFIETRYRALECLDFGRNVNSSQQHNKTCFVTTALQCEYCSKEHKLCFCKDFIKLDYDARHDFVTKNAMCYNCLGGNHVIRTCEKTTVCHLCKRRHHTLLHPPKRYNPYRETLRGDQGTQENNVSTNTARVVSCLSTGSGKITKEGQVLLATALIKAKCKSGEYQIVRALIDQGSQASFVTEDTVQYLRLPKHPVRGTISGLGNDNAIISKYLVFIPLQSLTDPSFKIEVKAYVLKNITSCLPGRKIRDVDWLELRNISLADPKFSSPNKINVLLGAEVFCKILRDGVKNSPTNDLIAQCTSFGWIISGIISGSSNNNEQDSPNISVLHAHVNEIDILKRFWEIEEQVDNSKKILTPEELKCEEMFAATTLRGENGRYIVQLPFRDNEPLCKGGNSREIAMKRFNGLERRLGRDKNLKRKYTEVIKEYLDLKHMRPIKENDDKKNEAVYLPHHAVIKEERSTTKVRVVFDASCKNSKGVSLNDTLMIGPSLQPDLRHTILRWRLHEIGIIADIVKMYRQVRVSEESAFYQRILWRDEPEDEIKDYELVTVTFGTASAPYQAVKALQQVAYDEGDNFPLAKNRVIDSYYMDDLMTGCSTVVEGVRIYEEMTQLLQRGGFELQKWNSNKKELLQIIRDLEDNKNIIKPEQGKVAGDGMEIKLDTTIKILGLTWKRDDDNFKYTLQIPTRVGPATKRSIISDIGRLFDPLGWTAPSVILAKMFIQKLWLAGLDWDERVSDNLLTEWNTYKEELPHLTRIEIPRWIGTKAGDLEIELHGFSDASKLAYAAVVYVRVINHDETIQVYLLTARTKVAPIKQRSIPRLELCGAWLLAQLLVEVSEVLKIPRDKVHAWTDSTVVLSWLNKHPSYWKTFVANRVSDILNKLDSSQWAHVASKENPADCASRGLQPSELADHKLWFSGPQFLLKRSITYERPKDLDSSCEEAVKCHITSIAENSPWDRFSSFRKLLRVIAYCRRFLTYKKNIGHTKYIKKVELDQALRSGIVQCQRQAFKEEYVDLLKKGSVRSRESKLKSLTPFIDDTGIIRVGGRLQASQLEEQSKNPIVLPHDSHFSNLLIAEAHQKTLHGGPQTMMNYLREAYWILGVKSLVRKHVHKCVTCVKYRADIHNQLMGSLPSVRVTPARAFIHTGVDYAGPINIRTTKGRGHRSYKGYICVFICMVTRAIHLEVVSDLTAQGFLAAFRRFVSRRGHCTQLWSDNGTNFVGAAKELQQLFKAQLDIIQHLESNGSEWHFIPPHAPNFGGLWEAGVKSTKYHLKRVIGDSTLTYEEMTTLLCQVEACLNSRPITLVSNNDPGDLVPLTPGHFLVGEPLIVTPSKSYEIANINCLTRWQLIQKMLQHFWRRWSQEYLTGLVHRYKWNSQTSEPQIGDIVLIKEDNLPPSRWMLGRVVQKHPGQDNLTRVVTLRTQMSTIKRPTSKLCVLPVSEHD